MYGEGLGPNAEGQAWNAHINLYRVFSLSFCHSSAGPHFSGQTTLSTNSNPKIQPVQKTIESAGTSSRKSFRASATDGGFFL